jgi:hypothetical protein
MKSSLAGTIRYYRPALAKTTKIVRRFPLTNALKAVRRIICKVDSPLGNPPQLRQTVISVVRVRRFADAKPPYNYKIRKKAPLFPAQSFSYSQPLS